MTEDTDDILRDIRRWVKIIGIQEAQSVLRQALSGDSRLDEEEMKIIYHLTDGNHSTRDIADYVSVGYSAVSDRQNMWAQMGLLEREHTRAPYEAVIDLEEAGIETPDIPESGEDSGD